MKKLLIPVLAIFVLAPAEKAFSIFGVGIYGLRDSYTIDVYQETFNFLGQDLVSMDRTEVSPPIGLGGFLYIDAIPFIDLEASFEVAAQTYDFTWDVAGQASETYEVAWGRTGLYLTARKELFGLGLPVLGGVKIHAGAGVNFQTSVPLVDKDFMEGLLESAQAEIDVDDIIDEVSKNTGYHVQASLQIKLVSLNLFINGRYTLVEDVIPNENAFLSFWIGLAFGI